jgi:hypothetical protein
MIQGHLDNASKKDTTQKVVAIPGTSKNTEQAFTRSPQGRRAAGATWATSQGPKFPVS